MSSKFAFLLTVDGPVCNVFCFVRIVKQFVFLYCVCIAA